MIKVGKIVEKGFKRYIYLEIFGNITIFIVEGNEIFFKKNTYSDFLKDLKNK
ncbi:MAG: hypothetical protein KatS3mg068_2482 [Candidatus Sericytochromatia bacterium]|nr:MAG: hypothetical protein KatS3mg068_2482 [Candidatus Sericytochromatia bacterium]